MEFKCSEQYIKKITHISEKCIGKSCSKCTQACVIIKSTPAECLEQTIMTSEFDSDTAFSCTQCNLCDSVCPASVNVSQIYLEQRRDILRHKKHSKTIHGLRSVKLNQQISYSSFMKAIHSPNEGANSVFMPGCSLSAYNPQLVEDVYRFITHKKPGTGIILNCCSAPTHMIGDERNFDRYYSSFIESVKGLGSPEIITACPSCYKLISEKSPSIKLTSIWELLEEIGFPNNCGFPIEHTNLILHDPCPARNYGSIHNSVRNLLSSANININEFAACKENTICCGVGGMVGVTNPALAKKNIGIRVSQASSDAIITYCASCVDAFRSVGKESYYLLELLFAGKKSTSKIDPTSSSSVATRWFNRALLTTKIRKHKCQGGQDV